MSDWYGAVNRILIPVAIDADPPADQVFPLFRAPRTCTIKAAYAAMTDAVVAHADNWVKLSLMNGGTAGSGTTAISDVLGGTVGWGAILPDAWTLSDGVLETGEVVVLKYDKGGTGAPGSPMVITMEILMQRSVADIDEELDTLVTAMETTRDIFEAAKADTHYKADSREFFAAQQAKLDKWLLQLAGDIAEAAIRMQDKAVGE